MNTINKTLSLLSHSFLFFNISHTNTMTENNQNLHTPIELILYLYTRLTQLGITTIHGSLFQFSNNLVQATNNVDLNYARSFNEAHAAFAADGYARVKGISALLSTYGPNDTATNQVLFRAHAENLPIVHIVGYPIVGQDQDREILRRLLRQGQVGSIDQAVAYNSVVVLGIFDHISHAHRRIDDALSDCLIGRRPVYIGVPMVYANCLVEGKGLERPVFNAVPRNDPRKEEHVTEVILRYLDAAKDPVIIVDGGVIRQGIQDIAQEFVEKSNLPTFVTHESKHVIDVSLPNHGGLYAGLQSAAGLKERVDASDLVIHIGPSRSHINTTRYLHYLEFRNKIEFHLDEHLVGHTMSYGLRSRGLLKALISRLHEVNLCPGPVPDNKGTCDPLDNLTLSPGNEDGVTTKNFLYPRILRWMRDGDLLINHFSIENAQNWVHHAIWERKDIALGACLGACIAGQEMGLSHRVLVFVDTPCFRHTSDELAVLLRLDLNPIIFIGRDASEETESESHGNQDIETRLSRLADYDFFVGGLKAEGPFKVYSIHTQRQLVDLLADEEFSSASCLQLVELFVHAIEKDVSVLDSGVSCVDEV